MVEDDVVVEDEAAVEDDAAVEVPVAEEDAAEGEWTYTPMADWDLDDAR